jgi:hypothetical protein
MKRAVRALIDSRILGRALMVGVILEVALMVASHLRPLLQLHYALFGIMMIAGTAALLYARDLARGYVMGALGGLVIGAACGVAAVATSNLLGDQPESFIPYGVMICALVGAIGGLFGQYAAWVREFIATLR